MSRAGGGRFYPYQVTILNEKDALIEYEKEVPITEVAQVLHGSGQWGELEVEVGCVISSKPILMNIIEEKKLRQTQRSEIQRQVARM